MNTAPTPTPGTDPGDSPAQGPTPAKITPEEEANRRPYIGLLLRLTHIADRFMHGAYHLAMHGMGVPGHQPRARHPGISDQRLMRAIARIHCLLIRLRDGTPLPALDPPEPPHAAIPRPPRLDIGLPNMRQSLELDIEQIIARTRIDRLLRKHCAAELIFMICRDLGIPGNPNLWTKVEAILPTNLPIPKFRLDGSQRRQPQLHAALTALLATECPQPRPDAHSDPPPQPG